MSTFTSPFTGNVIQPTDVSYYALSFNANTQLYWSTVVNPTQVPAARIIDCVPAAGSLVIFLPDATQGAVGSDILFRNLGAFPFTIKDAAGGESVSVPVGISKYTYLTDNTSTGGIWNNVTFAAGTSYADAATLQGAGLTTISGKLATTQNIIDVTSSPTIADSSRAATFVWGSGAGTFNLPNVATLSNGWYIGFRNNGTGSLSITPISPSTINNQATISANPGDSGFILYDSSTNNFITVGLTAPTNVTFTSATYDVDSIPGSTLSLVSYAPIIQSYIAQSGTRSTSLTITLPATTQIYILANNTGQPGYYLYFQVSGSSQPPLQLPAGSIATVLCDGTNIYPLTSGSSSSTFSAVNGLAAAPSYSFVIDSHTGMYLDGANILGLSANSTELIRVDNSNTLLPLVTINARVAAQLISGGTF